MVLCRCNSCLGQMKFDYYRYAIGINVTNGNNNILIDASNFSKGMYFVQLNISGKTAANTKFIKE